MPEKESIRVLGKQNEISTKEAHPEGKSIIQLFKERGLPSPTETIDVIRSVGYRFRFKKPI
ncbi:MAG: hypothetical protein ACD_30C00073G0006 [uncultured bacterium]|uniref:Uncharacterized protein n=3 Tax=Candidatus Daviesiibacteriota TaxID=1752718 RepID=A0A0G0H825_9BACT|nr:MAG: hypothetical protein ACD_30C00073G0006 [uncultured bacterium]KKQ08234.1 MAG: hypothetical protein US19_C0029G0005 [Candidatus Daviesbacteria bacterium GW2011_GWB1_36_5]KKQ16032.1 MAG: hypothetical protein US28_C0006G0027 [Candidatus Daviesbacteria bacterium GW2011_GWA1_36_8]OGE32273.1 MAG: hypothetical protein A3C99_03370 [Candidatus Daviesbacteria bacterium RIFCSPHIGHO2_02_FULL_37_9]OGE36369.1 MAG: hypothetical protein A3E66_05755 [Candidatus Daviesbacteria bacterium RIFCSPHIGHO2_12_FU